MSKAKHTELFVETEQSVNLRVRLIQWNEWVDYQPDSHTVFVLERYDASFHRYIPYITELWEGEQPTLIRRAISRFDAEVERFEHMKEAQP
jgi:hypothetical protein